jgi:site-specific recombinase XerD
VLPGHPLARQVDEFLADLANANKPRNTIRAYRGDLTGFTAHHDGQIAALSATPIRAFLGEIGQAPATGKRRRAAVVSFCKWAVRRPVRPSVPAVGEFVGPCCLRGAVRGADVADAPDDLGVGVGCPVRPG